MDHPNSTQYVIIWQYTFAILCEVVIMVLYINRGLRAGGHSFAVIKLSGGLVFARYSLSCIMWTARMYSRDIKWKIKAVAVLLLFYRTQELLMDRLFDPNNELHRHVISPSST